MSGVVIYETDNEVITTVVELLHPYTYKIVCFYFCQLKLDFQFPASI